VTHVACGYGFTIFACHPHPSGTVFGTGLNTSCQLGFHLSGDQGMSRQWLIQPEAINIPLCSPNGFHVVDVACGRLHTLIATDHEVFSLGNNSCGQCGRPIIEDEDYANNSIMHQVRGLEGQVKNVVCGLDHSFVLTTSGSVYAFGCGTDGQLGNETLESNWQPTLVGGDIKDERIIQVSSSADCVLALSDKGDVFGWGNSEYKQLGMVTDALQVSTPRHLKLNVGRVKQVAVGGSACALLTTIAYFLAEGEVHVWGFGIIGLGPENLLKAKPTLLPLPLFGATEFNPGVRVAKLTAGLMHFAAINNIEQLYTWGKNRFGLLGLGHDDDQFFPFKVTINSNVKEVALGPDHTVAICRTSV
ncbi:unnamed protein product, partial [Soboliphyme baturini]|uniref:Williams-Beuren syndrome chromosomal region 16 protein n=1 Tax=Soboliphyme baturini TaxID=241478 RepID=A0A183IRH0_9BILA